MIQGVKLKVNSQEQSKEFQLLCYKKGIKWASLECKEPIELDNEFLFISKSKIITCSNNIDVYNNNGWSLYDNFIEVNIYWFIKRYLR